MSTELLAKKSKAQALCLKIAREHFSELTGFVHFHAEKGEFHNHVIPVFENLCYALALFREKQSECIFEAKELLEKLFTFQTEDGAFPRFIHAYPNPAPRSILVSCLFALYWIYVDFHHVVEKGFQNALKSAIDRLLGYLDHESDKLFSLKKIQYDILSSLWRGLAVPDFTMPEGLDLQAKLCNFLAKVCPEKALPIFEDLQRFYDPVFLRNTSSFLQEKQSPQPGFFDLFFAVQTNRYSNALSESRALHFEGAFISQVSSGIENEEMPTQMFVGNGVNNREDHHFRYLWKEQNGFDSLVVQDHELSCIPTKEQYRYIFDFEYPKDFELDRQGLYELNIFTEFKEHKQILINGEKATTFQFGDVLTIQTPEHCFSFRSDLVEGEGKFFGHLLRGNRPSQTSSGVFDAFDYQISLRTIKRSNNVKIRLTLIE